MQVDTAAYYTMRLAASRLMEPVTHALASLTLGRAGLGRSTRWAVPMLLVSGLVADLDWVSYIAGAPAFLEWHRTASHSLLGAAVISVSTAAGFWLASRQRNASGAVRFFPALAVCAASAGLHLLLDLTNSDGVKLLWPFSPRWFAWDLSQTVDPGLLAILLVGLLVPGLLNLIGEEIGGRSGRRPAGRGAVIALSVAALYMCARGLQHQRAEALLNAHTYRQETPIRTAAFPASSPFLWHGVAETQTALHQVEVPLLPGPLFDARTARSRFKPENSQALERAVASPAGRTFLAYARFPLASVEPMGEGVEVRMRDLRDASATPDSTHVVAIMTLNARGEITRNALQFETSPAH